MNDQQRALLAAALSFVILIGWYMYFGKNTMSPPAAVQQSVPVAAPTRPPSEDVKPETPSASSQPEEVVVEEKITEKQTPLYRIRWTNRGARPAAISLKHFQKEASKESPSISFLEMTGEKALSFQCSSCSSQLPSDDQYLQVAETESSIAFEGRRGGLRVRKIYSWTDNQYLLNLKVMVQNDSDQDFHGRLALVWDLKQLPQTESQGWIDRLKGPPDRRLIVYKLGNDIVRDEEMEEPKEIHGMVPWVGIEDRYFLMSLISRKVSSDDVLSYKASPESLQFTYAMTSGETVIGVGSSYEENYSFYVGPKNRDALMVANVELERAVDYGWFSFFAIPILKLLQFFHRFVGNWGIAIIILTLFVKILMNPLTIKSMKQMKEMQNLQPKLAELKKKYTNDKQRLNMETMQLFKTHKVNPMGGCLPMLLQMPIYIALYKVLYNATELYHAPFFWIYRDLSAPDPYFILPVLLGAFMFLQQKMTPMATTDPVQKQMMMIMPIMFTGFMLFLPVGLVVYILVNTSTGVLQQWMSQNDYRWRDIPKLFMKKSG